MLSVGGVYMITFPVTDATGAPANADTVTLTITLPDGTTVTPSVTNPPAVTGQYTYGYATTTAGRHTVHVLTANPVTTWDDEFDVAPDVTPAIVSLAEAKAQLQIDPGDTSDDDQIRAFVEALTGVVEEYLHQVVVPRQFTDDPVRLFRARSFRLWNNPVLSLTSVATWDGLNTWDVSNMHVTSSGVVRVMTGPSLHGEVVPVYQAGMNPVPWKIKQGALVILQHVFETQRGQGTTMSGVVGEEERYRQPGEWFTVPNKAKEYLGPARPVVA